MAADLGACVNNSPVISQGIEPGPRAKKTTNVSVPMMAKIPVEIFKFLYSVCSEKSDIKTEPEPEQKPFFKKPVPEPTFF